MDDAAVERLRIGDTRIHHQFRQLLVHLPHFLYHTFHAFFQQWCQDATPHSNRIRTKSKSLVSVITRVYTTVAEYHHVAAFQSLFDLRQDGSRRYAEGYSSMMMGDKYSLAAGVTGFERIRNRKDALGYEGQLC